MCYTFYCLYMENAEIIFTVRINDGREVIIKTTIEELEIESLPDLLINEGYIKHWANNGEYTVIGREIK